MRRDELLDKLAMELPSWRKTWNAPDGFAWDDMEEIVFEQTGDSFIQADWLQRRAELINRPPDSEAPEWARWLAQGVNGTWVWYEKKPKINIIGFKSNSILGIWAVSRSGKIPAGHDWTQTLTEIKPMQREFNPTTSSLTDSQAREYAGVTKQCSDGKPCGAPYCEDCPNQPTPEEDGAFNAMSAKQEQPHEADARMLDVQLMADMGKQPRYQDAKGEDWIDEFARTKTREEFRGAMSFNIGKYNRRVGKKDDILHEVRKMKDYCIRWEQYELSQK